MVFVPVLLIAWLAFSQGLCQNKYDGIGQGKSTSLLQAATRPPEAQKRAPPRTGPMQSLLNFALESPVWKYVLVPQARANIVKTAESNGIPWNKCKQWIRQSTESSLKSIESAKKTGAPSYYKKAFHAYEEGNLCMDAAYEVEIASCAVGARNFPAYGPDGEDAFRGAFHSALLEGNAAIPKDGAILDMGCGTGMSTRRLGENFPHAANIVGVDLSPYFVEVGKQLLLLEPSSFKNGGNWVSSIKNDDRIKYLVGDASNTGMESGSFDAVNLQFVIHELPPKVTRLIIEEAHRLLKPKGQLWISEMDFEAPAYAQQRSNPLLFSLIRSTEPYLDEYADSISDFLEYLPKYFKDVTIVPATGRHFAIVAQKGDANGLSPGRTDDRRFNEQGEYIVEDTHLKVWESSKD